MLFSIMEYTNECLIIHIPYYKVTFMDLENTNDKLLKSN